MELEGFIINVSRTGDIVMLYGYEVLCALFVIVVGLLTTKIAVKGLKWILERFLASKEIVSTISNIIFVLLAVIVFAIALEHAGVRSEVINRSLAAAALVIAAIMLLIRPLLPTLPFKVGNTVKFGDLLGKVEATTLLNTRLRTFDGKTVFVPNSKILNDFVINYHFTGTRRIKINVGIGYDQDLLKAKQILEAIMIEDPRVKVKPRPVVYVLNLGNSCVELGGRCWVDNLKFWTTRCELIEKTKLGFDQQGITIAFPQLDVHYYHGTAPPEFPGEENTMPEKKTKQIKL
jgi:small conductance mechanosensitive channel